MSKQPTESWDISSARLRTSNVAAWTSMARSSVAIEPAQIAVRFMEAHQPMDQRDLLERVADRLMRVLLVDAVDADGRGGAESGRARSMLGNDEGMGSASSRFTPSAMCRQERVAPECSGCRASG